MSTVVMDKVDVEMSFALPFPQEELDNRLQTVRELMDARGLSGAIIASPENIFYLTGLDHWGFFALHLLIVPKEGPLWIITRAMESAAMREQIPHVIHSGYRDDEDPVEHTAGVIKKIGLDSGQIGIEYDVLFLSAKVAYGLADALSEVKWSDISGMVDDLRLVKSHLELEYVRKAAKVTQAMMQAAIDTAHEGVNEREIAAEVHRAMILAGGDFPGFGPFIRSTPTLDQEHLTWQDRNLVKGDRLFLEMSGCVRRYHAPMGRLLFVGEEPPELSWIKGITWDAFNKVVETIRPGAVVADVYQAWQTVVDNAGLSHYQRHHCGYLVGVGFPPSWVGGNKVLGLRRGSQRIMQEGMVMHLLSWLLGSGKGDYFVSNAAIVTKTGCEVLTSLPKEVTLV